MPATERYSLGRASILKPVDWTATPYYGEPATVVFPIVFLSSSPMITRCSRAQRTLCTTANWFPLDVRTPDDGVVVLWLSTSFPTDAGWPALPGRPTTVDRRAARIYAGPPIGGCPDGAAREIDANVRVAVEPVPGTHTYPGSRLAMTACLGPHASAAERGAVMTMLRSLRVRL